MFVIYNPLRFKLNMTKSQSDKIKMKERSDIEDQIRLEMVPFYEYFSKYIVDKALNPKKRTFLLGSDIFRFINKFHDYGIESYYSMAYPDTVNPQEFNRYLKHLDQFNDVLSYPNQLTEENPGFSAKMYAYIKFIIEDTDAEIVFLIKPGYWDESTILNYEGYTKDELIRCFFYLKDYSDRITFVAYPSEEEIAQL